MELGWTLDEVMTYIRTLDYVDEREAARAFDWIVTARPGHSHQVGSPGQAVVITCVRDRFDIRFA